MDLFFAGWFILDYGGWVSIADLLTSFIGQPALSRMKLEGEIGARMSHGSSTTRAVAIRGGCMVMAILLSFVLWLR